jgi:hypothetical protein
LKKILKALFKLCSIFIYTGLTWYFLLAPIFLKLFYFKFFYNSLNYNYIFVEGVLPKILNLQIYFMIFIACFVVYLNMQIIKLNTKVTMLDYIIHFFDLTVSFFFSQVIYNGIPTLKSAFRLSLTEKYLFIVAPKPITNSPRSISPTTDVKKNFY